MNENRDWGMPPTIAKRWEPSSDIVALVIYNLTDNKGMAFRTSRPYVAFLRFAYKMVTDIRAEQLNAALNNLVLSGSTVLERDGSTPTQFLFYLEYEDEKVPYSQPFEVDSKMAVFWPKEFADVEAELIQRPSSMNEIESDIIDL